MSARLTTAVGPGDPGYDAGPVNVTPLQLANWIVVCSEAELFPGTGSVCVPLTVALFVTVPALSAIALMVTVADALTASEPTAQVTLRLTTVHVPRVDVADETDRPAGSVSVTTTPVAADGPAL